MIRRLLRRLARDERGFTFFEILIAGTIAMVIAGGITATTLQVFNNNLRNTNHMTAVREVQNVGYWVSRDGQMTEPTLTPGSLQPFPLVLTWHNLDGTSETIVTYYFSGTQLKRKVEVDGVVNADSQIAEHVISASMNWSFTTDVHGRGTMTINVTATVGTAQTQTESRQYEVLLRPYGEE